MSLIRKAATAAVLMSIIAGTAPSLAMAQAADTGTSAPKQVQRAQRKADGKAARSTKNAELSTLEKNSYQPAGDQQLPAEPSKCRKESGWTQAGVYALILNSSAFALPGG